MRRTACGPLQKQTFAPGRGPSAPAAGSVPGPHASPLVVEALTYLGGALAVVAGFVAVRQVWPDIPPRVPRCHARSGVVGGHSGD